MSAVGFDIGNYKSTVAAVSGGKVTILLNDMSNRSTPTLVAFNEKRRKFGEGAKLQEISNLKNTISTLKRVLGLSYAEIKQKESRFLSAAVVEIDGQVYFKVQFLGKEELFTPVQLMAIFLAGLKETSERDLGNGAKVYNCVISVPAYFNEYQRRLMLEAARIAGLLPYKLINEPSAVALEYGIYRNNELSEDKPRNVIFVDIGHSASSATVVSYLKGKLEIKGSASDSQLGGRDIDLLIFDHYVHEFSSKYHIDIKSNPKAVLRLMLACEKLKKTLSANSVADLSVECIMNDVDVCKTIKREELEALIAPFLPRICEVLTKALEMSKIPMEEIHFVEICGGSVRIPIVQETIRQFFSGKVLSKTLNFDEAACSGATLQCAILSPSFKVRDFHIKELITRSVKCFYDASEENPNDTGCILFPAGSSFPSLKEITFKRSKPFSFSFCYADESDERILSSYSISTPGKIKVRVRMNQDGFVQVESAALIEETVVEENDADGNPVEKKQTSLKNIEVSGGFTYGIICEQKALDIYIRKEQEMQKNDSLVKRTEEEKNATEEFIYRMRDELGSKLANYASQKEKQAINKLMEDVENWLYNDGQDSTYEAYHERNRSLTTLGMPIMQRFKAAADLEVSFNNILATCNEIESRLSSESCSHLSSEDAAQIQQILSTRLAHAQESFKKQQSIPHWEKAVFTAADIECIRGEIISLTQPILAKAKPVVEKQEEPKPMETNLDEETLAPCTEKHGDGSDSIDEEIENSMSP